MFSCHSLRKRFWHRGILQGSNKAPQSFTASLLLNPHCCACVPSGTVFFLNWFLTETPQRNPCEAGFSLSNSEVQMFSALLSRLGTNTIRSLQCCFSLLIFYPWQACYLPFKGAPLTKQLRHTGHVAPWLYSGLEQTLSIPHWTDSCYFTLLSSPPC